MDYSKLEYVQMTILGIDPGIGRIGWGLINETSGKQILINYGCFETKSTLCDEVRLTQIHQFFSNLINESKPDTAVVEELFFAANTKTAFSVGQARGVIVLTISEANIPIISYTPLQVKQAISGYGRAEKMQIQIMVKNLLKMSCLPKPDDAADALAIALTHAFSYKLKSATNNKNIG